MQMRTREIILAIGGAQAVALAGCAANGPDMQGFSPERLRRLDSVFVQQAIARGTMPGVVMLVARNGSIVKFSADGYLDARKTKPMRRDAIFRLASLRGARACRTATSANCSKARELHSHNSSSAVGLCACIAC